MATLYPENTQYNTTGSAPVPPSIKYSSLGKMAPNRSLPQLNTPTPKRVLPQGNFGAFAAQPTGLTPQEKELMTSSESNFPVQSPIIPGAAATSTLQDFLAKQKELYPGGMSDFAAPGTGAMNQFYETPGGTTQVINVAGGGQYLVDPNDPSKIIRSNRDFSPDQNTLIRNGLNPALYTIDHIVPLWMGGANTLENRLIQRTDDSFTKDKTEMVLQTLYANKVIKSIPEALKYMLNWKNNDVSGVEEPSTYPNGFVPLDVAQRAYANWQKAGTGEPIDTGSSWKNFINTLTSIPKNVYKDASKYYQNVMLGGQPETETSAVLKEFGKHLVSAIPFSDVLVPDIAKTGAYKRPEMQQAANIMAFTGRLTGDLITFGATRALAAKTLSAIGIGAKATEGATLGLSAARSAEEAASASKTALEIGGNLLKSPTLGVAETGLGQWTIPEITSKMIRGATLSEAVKNGLVMAALGQTHQQTPGEEDIASRLKTMGVDMMYGSLLGTQGHSIGGYAKVGGLTMMLGLMNGQPSQDAALNSLTMMALHGLSHGSKNSILELAKQDPEYAASLVREKNPLKALPAPGLPGEVDVTAPPITAPKEPGRVSKVLKRAGSVFYSPDIDTKMVEAAQRTIVKKLQAQVIDQSIKYRMSYLGKDYQYSTDRETLQKQNELIHQKINEEAAYYDWSPEQVRREKFKAYTSARELYKSALPTEIRNKEDLSDLMSIGRKITETGGQDPLDAASDVTKIVNKMPQELFVPPNPEETHTNSSDPNTPSGITMLGGSGFESGAGIEVKDNLDFMAKLADTGRAPVTRTTDERSGEQSFLMRVIIAHEPEQESTMRGISNAFSPKDIAEGNKKPMAHPENYVGIFGYGKDENGNLFVKRLPPVAREFRLQKLNEEHAKWKYPPPPLDTGLNKDAISNLFKDKNIKYSFGDVMYTPETKVVNYETGRPTSYAKLYVNEDIFGKNAQVVKDLLTQKSTTPPAIPREVFKAAMAEKLKNPPVIPSAAPIELGPKAGESPIKPTAIARPLETPAEKPQITARPIEPKIAEEKPMAKVINTAEQPPFTTSEKSPKALVEEARVTPSETPTINDTFQENSDKTSARDWRKYSNEKIIKGFADDIDNQLKDTDPNSPRYKAAIEFKKEYTSITARAKELVAAHDGDEASAFESFMSELNDGYRQIGLDNPITESPRIESALKSLFKKEAQSFANPTILFTKDGGATMIQKTPEPENYINQFLEKYNKENESDLALIKMQAEEGLKIPKTKEGLKTLEEKFYENGIVPFGYAGNKSDTLFGITYDPKIGGSKDIKTGASKFFNTVVHDILGVDRSENMGTLNKRWKELLFSEFKPINDPGDFKRLIVIDFGKDEFGNQIVDGASFAHARDLREIAIEGGYLKKSRNYLSNKNVIVDNSLEGLTAIKNQLYGIRPDSEMARKIEEYVRKFIPDYNFQSGDYITSNNNVKLGKKILANFGEGKPNFYAGEIPMDALRAKYDLPKAEEKDFKFSPYLISKYGFGDKLNGIIEKMYGPAVDRTVSAIDALFNKATTAAEGRKILDEYKDIFKGALGEDLYGKTSKIIKNGGWGKNGDAIRFELEEAVTKAFREYVLNGKFLESTYAKFLPDIGALKDASGKSMWVPEDSLVLSKKTMEDLGNPKEVMVLRHPNTKRSGILALKTITAEDHGITDLGDAMIINNTVGYKELYFDTDGDAGPVFPVGKSEDGKFLIPQEIADRAKEIYKTEGKREPIKMSDHEKLPITLSNSLEMGSRSVKGGDSVGENSTMRRVLQGIIDNNTSVGVWTLKAPEKGESMEERNQKMFDFFEYMNNASTDSVKKRDLNDQLTKYKVNSLSDLLRNKFFDPPKGVNEKVAIKNFTTDFFKLSPIFDYADSDNRVTNFNKMGEELKNYYKDISSKRAQPGPIDVLAKLINDKIPTLPKPLGAAEQQAFHNARVESMEAAIKENGIAMASPEDLAVKDFRNYLTKTKDQVYKDIMAIPEARGIAPKLRDPETNIKIKRLKNTAVRSITDYYYAKEPEMTQEQRRAIAYWLITSPKANFANTDYNPKWEGSPVSFQVRLPYIFNDVPELAKPYYAADVNAIDLTPKKPEEQKPTVITARPSEGKTTEPQTKNPTVKYAGLKMVTGATKEGQARQVKATITKKPGAGGAGGPGDLPLDMNPLEPKGKYPGAPNIHTVPPMPVMPESMAQSTPAMNMTPLLDARNKTIIDNTRKDFPFTEDAQNIFNYLKFNRTDKFPESPTIQGVFHPGGKIPSVLAPLKFLAQGIDKITNVGLTNKLAESSDPAKITLMDKTLENPEIPASHEMLHAAFQQDPGLLDPFNESWDRLKKHDSDVGPFLEEIDKHLANSNGLYDTKDPYTVGTERFAYLGESVLQYGIDILPKQLQPFYSQWIKGIKNQDNTSTPWGTTYNPPPETDAFNVSKKLKNRPK